MPSAATAWFHENSQAHLSIDKKVPGVARAICSPEEIRLPRSTSRRDAGGWIKLIERVNDAPGGFAFEGKVLRTGGTIPATELPDPAVLLECCGTEGRGRGHNRGDTRYIIWRWNPRVKDWEDLGQASSVTDEWTIALKGIARRALDPADEIVTPFDCEASVDRIMSFAESEIHGMPPRSRNRVLERLYGRVAGLVAA